MEQLVKAGRRVGHGLSVVALGLLLPAAIFGLWLLAVQRQWLPEQILPPPSLVWESLVDVIKSGELFNHLRASGMRVAWSLLIGGSIGVLLGLAMGLSRTFHAYVFPTFDVVSQFPVLGWIPLLIIFVGIDEGLKITAISLSVVVPLAVNTLSGIRNIPRALLEVGQVYRLRPLQVVRRIVLPAALPSLFTGIRQGVMQAWISLVFVELLVSDEGLGFLMAYSRSLAQIDMVIVAMLAIGVVGILIELALRLVESRLQSWRRTAF
jgi:sulfonate transport system permease protein